MRDETEGEGRGNRDDTEGGETPRAQINAQLMYCVPPRHTLAPSHRPRDVTLHMTTQVWHKFGAYQRGEMEGGRMILRARGEELGSDKGWRNGALVAHNGCIARKAISIHTTSVIPVSRQESADGGNKRLAWIHGAMDE